MLGKYKAKELKSRKAEDKGAELEEKIMVMRGDVMEEEEEDKENKQKRRMKINKKREQRQ